MRADAGGDGDDTSGGGTFESSVVWSHLRTCGVRHPEPSQGGISAGRRHLQYPEHGFLGLQFQPPPVGSSISCQS